MDVEILVDNKFLFEVVYKIVEDVYYFIEENYDVIYCMVYVNLLVKYIKIILWDVVFICFNIRRMLIWFEF